MTIVAVLGCPICKREVEVPIPFTVHDGFRCASCEAAGHYHVFLREIGFREVPQMTAEELEKAITVIGSSGVMCGLVPDTPKDRAELRANGFEISNGIATKEVT